MLGRGEFYEIPAPFELDIGVATPEADGRRMTTGDPAVGTSRKRWIDSAGTY
jgi:hypothetical protein